MNFIVLELIRGLKAALCQRVSQSDNRDRYKDICIFQDREWWIHIKASNTRTFAGRLIYYIGKWLYFCDVINLYTCHIVTSYSRYLSFYIMFSFATSASSFIVTPSILTFKFLYYVCIHFIGKLLYFDVSIDTHDTFVCLY